PGPRYPERLGALRGRRGGAGGLLSAARRRGGRAHRANRSGEIVPAGGLGGRLALAAGRVLLCGHDVTSLPPYRRARLGLVRTFQHTSTFNGLTVFENLLVSAMSGPRFPGSRLRDALAGGQGRGARQGAAA